MYTAGGSLQKQCKVYTSSSQRSEKDVSSYTPVTHQRSSRGYAHILCYYSGFKQDVGWKDPYLAPSKTNRTQKHFTQISTF